MEWHCSFYWQHAIDQQQIINSKNSFEILNNQIALPILLKKSIEDYEKDCRWDSFYNFLEYS